MPNRRPRLTRRDLDHIHDAMGFILAGEWPFDDPDADDEELERRRAAFERTYDKIARS